MKNTLKELELLIGREVQSPPKPEDFESKGSYLCAKILHKRFPKELNPPSSAEFSGVKELSELWAWANGEKGIGKIKPGYRLMSMEESSDVKDSLYSSAPVEWLNDLHPFFLAPNDFYICVKSSTSEVVAVNLTAGRILVLSGDLDRYFKFLISCISKGVYGDAYCDDLDPESYIKKEVEAAREVGLSGYYPLTDNKKTVLDSLIYDDEI